MDDNGCGPADRTGCRLPDMTAVFFKKKKKIDIKVFSKFSFKFLFLYFRYFFEFLFFFINEILIFFKLEKKIGKKLFYFIKCLMYYIKYIKDIVYSFYKNDTYKSIFFDIRYKYIIIICFVEKTLRILDDILYKVYYLYSNYIYYNYILHMNKKKKNFLEKIFFFIFK